METIPFISFHFSSLSLCYEPFQLCVFVCVQMFSPPFLPFFLPFFSLFIHMFMWKMHRNRTTNANAKCFHIFISIHHPLSSKAPSSGRPLLFVSDRPGFIMLIDFTSSRNTRRPCSPHILFFLLSLYFLFLIRSHYLKV